MRYILFSLLLGSIFCSNSGYAQIQLDLDSPTVSAKIFAPMVISTNLKERDLTISPDGTEIYYTVFKAGFDGDIYFIQKNGDEWTIPAIAPFSGNEEDLEPAFNPQGDKLFFASRRGGEDYNIWYVQKEGTGAWSAPVNVGSPVNTTKNEFYPSISNDGSLYYTAEYTNGVGGEDIWYSQNIAGVYQKPIALPNVSTVGDEFNAFVDPEERYIYFGSFGRADGLGGGDIYISRKQPGGSWGTAKNLGDNVNTEFLDYSPSVSPDGEYLFFTSVRRTSLSVRSNNPFDLSAVLNSLLTPNKEGSSIYWIKR